MNHPIIPIAVVEASRQRKRQAPKGRRVEPQALAEVQSLLGAEPRRADLLIEHLHKIQDRFGHLSAAHLAALAQEMRMAQTEVYEVATFYHHFDVVKEGEAAPAPLTVRVCDGLACEMAGAKDLLNKLPSLLGREVRVIAAPCIGRCEQAPAAVVGQNPVPHATCEAVAHKVKAGAVRHEPEDHVDFARYQAAGGYKLLRQCIAGDRDVEKIYIYLRDEYHGCRALLETELAKLRAAPPVAGMPEIELRRGAGAYICGEESAMIESIEGKRGMPRLRPPYVAQVGLFGRPTLEHNFDAHRPGGDQHAFQEAVRVALQVDAVLEGAGLALVDVDGHQARTRFAAHDAPLAACREACAAQAAQARVFHGLDDQFGMLHGHKFYAYLPGGASGGILPATMNDIPLDFDTLQPYGCFIGSAAVMVLSDHDSATDAARNMMRFFHHESCGQCTPCRVGTAKAAHLIDQEKWDLPLLADLSLVMRDASICGLGQAAPNPVDCVIKYFPHELA